MDKAKNIDGYIASFPPGTSELLEQVRAIIRETVPEAEETISYGIPCFKLNGSYLVYFAGYKKHIGMYPVPTADKELVEAYSTFKTSGKGTIQLPLDKPLPKNLIRKILLAMERENKNRVSAGKKAKTKK